MDIMWARNSPKVGFGERETPKARELFRLLRLRQAERRLDSPAPQPLRYLPPTHHCIIKYSEAWYFAWLIWRNHQKAIEQL